jgi:hypothetical protein
MRTRGTRACAAPGLRVAGLARRVCACYQSWGRRANLETLTHPDTSSTASGAAVPSVRAAQLGGSALRWPLTYFEHRGSKASSSCANAASVSWGQ